MFLFCYPCVSFSTYSLFYQCRIFMPIKIQPLNCNAWDSLNASIFKSFLALSFFTLQFVFVNHQIRVAATYETNTGRTLKAVTYTARFEIPNMLVTKAVKGRPSHICDNLDTNGINCCKGINMVNKSCLNM